MFGAVFSQTYRYDAFVFNKKVGDDVAKKELTDSSIVYKTYGKGKARIIISLEANYYSVSCFLRGTFKYSQSKLIRNGTLKDSVVVRKHNDNYIINIKDEESYVVTTAMPYTGNMMFFQEPNNKESVFSEKKGRYIKIKKIGEHSYKSYDVEAKTESYYYYAYGILTKVILDGGFVEVVLKLKTNNDEG